MALKSWLAYAVALTTALASAVSCNDAFPNAEFEKPERCAEAGEFAEVLPHCGLNGSGGLRVHATDKKHDGVHYRFPSEFRPKAGRKYVFSVCRKVHGKVRASLYWESRMARWTPYTFRGVLWIQGSSNKEDPRYCEKLHALYSGWTRLFENPGMSFYLAETGHGDGTCFNLQLQQARFVAEEPNAALAPANDVGNPRDAHGNDKEMIARRLLLHALRRNYGFTDVRSEPPVVKSARASGELAVLAIEHVRTLYVYNADFSLKTCFELAGDDGIWHPAEIVNFTRTAWSMDGYIASPEIVLKAKGVNKPCRARYLHGKSAPSNVFGDTCLPLLAFETAIGAVK